MLAIPLLSAIIILVMRRRELPRAGREGRFAGFK